LSVPRRSENSRDLRAISDPFGRITFLGERSAKSPRIEAISFLTPSILMHFVVRGACGAVFAFFM